MHIARTLAQRHYFHAYAFVSARMDAHAGVRRPDHLAECHGIVSTRSFLRNILRLTVTRTLAIYHFFFFIFFAALRRWRILVRKSFVIASLTFDFSASHVILVLMANEFYNGQRRV